MKYFPNSFLQLERVYNGYLILPLESTIGGKCIDIWDFIDITVSSSIHRHKHIDIFLQYIALSCQNPNLTA